MGYLITAGAGVLLGLGLMIWALRERRARHTAERQADKAIQSANKSDEIAKGNARAAQKAGEYAKKLEQENVALRQRLNRARSRLVQLKDPQAIRAWLDAELESEEV